MKIPEFQEETGGFQDEKRDFQDTVEDILKAIEMGGAIAIAENKALGLASTYLEDGKIIKEYADGTKEVLGEVEQPIAKYKKGQILILNGGQTKK